MKTILSKLAPYIMAILVFFIFNSLVCSYLIYNQKKDYNLLLKGYADAITSLLANDLKNALNSTLSNKKFFIIKDFQVNPRLNQTINLVTSNSSVIKVKNSEEEYIFDLQGLKENISNILPLFITYELNFNNSNLLNTGNQKTIYNLTENKIVGLNDILALKLAIKEDSIFYLDKRHLLKKNILTSLISSFLLLSIFLYFYLKISSKREMELNILHQEIYEEKEISTALLCRIYN